MENNDPPSLPPVAVLEPPTPRVVAGFWRRVGAALIDGLVLGAFGWLLGFFFARQFMEMGGWGRLVGFVVALLYFVPLNSRLFGGQTLGKRALGIRVTSRAGAELGLTRSFVRACILLVPCFLNGALIPLRYLQPPFGILWSVAIFGFVFSLAYLIVCNRRTRQSLHDLVVGSYVVPAGTERSEKPRIWAGHYVVVGLIFLFAALIPIVTSRILPRTFLAEILPAYEAILREPEVTTTQVMMGTSSTWTYGKGGASHTYTTGLVRLNRHVENKEAEATKIARIILQHYPAAKSKDALSITLAEGFDIGIASGFVTQSFVHPPAEWLQADGRSAPPQ